MEKCFIRNYQFNTRSKQRKKHFAQIINNFPYPRRFTNSKNVEKFTRTITLRKNRTRKNHFKRDSTFPADLWSLRVRRMEKWKNGKYKDTCNTPTWSYTRIQMRWKFRRTGRPKGSRRKAASVLERKPAEEERGSKEQDHPSRFLSYFSVFLPAHGGESLLFWTLDQNLFTRGKILRGLPALPRKQRYFSTLSPTVPPVKYIFWFLYGGADGFITIDLLLGDFLLPVQMDFF